MTERDPALKYAERDIATLVKALSYVGEKRVAVQAGGCLGTFADFLSAKFAAVYVAEPDPQLFRIMSNFLPQENVIRLQVAFGMDRVMVSTVRARRDGNTQRRYHAGVTHVVPGGAIPTIRVDDLGLPVCNFLCLDVEGYELYALQGAEETVERCRPVVMIEINSNIEVIGLTGEDVRTWLRMHDYDRVATVHSDEIYVPRKK